jgi:hypothetical protein
MLKYGETIFPGVPVVNASTEFEGFVDSQLSARYSGVTGMFESAKAIELILKNHSNTNKIDVNIGTSENEKKLLAKFIEEAEPFKKLGTRSKEWLSGEASLR